MTPSMRLSKMLLRYKGDPDYGEIAEDINGAFALGHEFGLARAAEMAKAINPFAYITKRLAELKVVELEGSQKNAGKIRDDPSVQHYLSEDGRFDAAIIDGVIVGITIIT